MIEECWCEEGGIRLRVSEGEGGRRVIQVVSTTGGWPGTVLATATLADFRRERIARAIWQDSEATVAPAGGELEGAP